MYKRDFIVREISCCVRPDKANDLLSAKWILCVTMSNVDELTLAVESRTESSAGSKVCITRVCFVVRFQVLAAFVIIHWLIVHDGPLASLFWVSWSHIQTHGRTPLDEWSARRRDLYLHRTTQHIHTTDKHPCPQRNSNPRPQQPSGRRPTL
jgi:hypothetical protein